MKRLAVAIGITVGATLAQAQWADPDPEVIFGNVFAVPSPISSANSLPAHILPDEKMPTAESGSFSSHRECRAKFTNSVGRTNAMFRMRIAAASPTIDGYGTALMLVLPFFVALGLILNPKALTEE